MGVHPCPMCPPCRHRQQEGDTTGDTSWGHQHCSGTQHPKGPTPSVAWGHELCMHLPHMHQAHSIQQSSVVMCTRAHTKMCLHTQNLCTHRACVQQRVHALTPVRICTHTCAHTDRLMLSCTKLCTEHHSHTQSVHTSTHLHKMLCTHTPHT